VGSLENSFCSFNGVTYVATTVLTVHQRLHNGVCLFNGVTTIF
jgi:hypothetical protein